MEIEPGLADADDARVGREPDQIGRAQRRVIGRIVRVDADRAPDVGVGLGDRPHAWN